MKGKYDIWLSAVEGVGVRKYHSLCSYFGDARSVYENANSGSLTAIRGFDSATAGRIIAAQTDGSLDENLEKLYKGDISTYIYGEDRYPEILTHIADAPPVLYTKGCYDLRDMDRSIGMVGTRRCTRYGRSVTEQIAEELADRSVVIISGMARGIDTHAHIGALNAGGFTIAVLGCGVDVIYPPENKQLYGQIMESGAILSDFFPGTKPNAINFPARNRIISALSMGIVVVESAEKGGALITTDFALEHGKEVFAVPGNIDSRASKGCNKLIQDGAQVVTCSADILSAFGWDAVFNPKKAVEQGVELSFDEMKIVELLTAGDLQYDILADEMDMNDSDLNLSLTLLCLQGIIKQLPGRVYGLVRTI